MTATLADNTRSDVLVPDGIHLEVIGEDGKPLVSAYEHGWRAGTEQVHVHLVFSVESFEPRTTLTITSVVVRNCHVTACRVARGSDRRPSAHQAGPMVPQA